METPPHQGKDAAPRPLPRFLTSFVGREREIAAVSALLHQEEIRLLTLTGPGGVGKTRFALEVASRAAAAYPHGVAFVDLAPIVDPSLVASAIAQAVGLRGVGEEKLAPQVAAVLRDQGLLLVLDNFEHLLAAAPLITDLLMAASRLTVLVTSRTRLRLSGEHVFAVAPLRLPGGSEADADGAAASEAIRLFVSRARQVDPAFALAEGNLDDVVEVCRRLDGLPLALELAAARVHLLPPRALLTRLGQRFPLLVAGPRDQPDRLRTLRQAIAWSHDLLSEGERAVFRRLAVFAGGCTLESAAAVAAAEDETEAGVLTGIAGLVEANLMRMEDQADAEPRYLMLETIREFGLEHLAAGDEEAEVRRRHAAWCLALAERAEPELIGPEQRQWFQRLEQEYANLRVAHSWFVERAEAGPALRLGGALWAFWFVRGRLREGYEWLMRGLAIDADAPPVDRVRALWGAGMLAWALGDFGRAEEIGLQARAIGEEHGLAFGTATALYLLFLATEMQNRHDEAMSLGEASVALMRASGVRSWLAYVLGDVGTRLVERGDRTRGQAWIDEGLAIHRELGNQQGLGNKLSDLALASHEAGDLRTAAGQYAESLRRLWAGGDTWYLASPIEGIAAIAVECGRVDQAARLLGAAVILRERSGGTVWPDERARLQRATAATRAALGEDEYARAAAAGRALSLADVVAEATAMVDALLGETSASPVPAPADTLGLSPRELEVLRLVARGKKNPEIADALYISRGTVKTHMVNILAKVGAASRTEAAAIARRRGLL